MLRLVFRCYMLAIAVSVMTLPLTRPTFAQESQQPPQQQQREAQEAQERAKVQRYGQQCVETVDRAAPGAGSGVIEPSSSGQRTQLYRSCLDSNGVIPGSLGYFGRSN